MNKLLVRVVAAVVVMVAMSSQPAQAADDCGMLGWLIGCTAQSDHTEAMAEINAGAAAAAKSAELRQREIDARKEIDARQIEYQRFLATQDAQAEIARIAANERVSMAEIQARLEAAHLASLTRTQEVAAQERMAAVSANTAFNIAALQTDAIAALSAARAEAERTRQTTSLVVLVIVLFASGALVYAAVQYRAGAEYRGRVQLLPDASEWQRRAVAMLEQKNVPWRWEGQHLIAKVDREWVIIDEGVE